MQVSNVSEEELAEAKLLVERLSRSERDVKAEIDKCATWIILLLAQESDAKDEAERENKELQDEADALKAELQELKNTQQKKEDVIANNQKMARKHVDTLRSLKDDLDEKTFELQKIDAQLKELSKKHKVLMKENLSTFSEDQRQLIKSKGNAPTPPLAGVSASVSLPNLSSTPRSGRPSGEFPRGTPRRDK